MSNLDIKKHIIEHEILGIPKLLNTEDHKLIRDLIHFIDEGPAQGFVSGAYKETLPYGQPFPVSETWWTNSSKTNKIIELLITRNSNQMPIIEEWNLYDTDGSTIIASIIDNYEYVNNVFEVSKTRTIS